MPFFALRPHKCDESPRWSVLTEVRRWRSRDHMPVEEEEGEQMLGTFLSATQPGCFCGHSPFIPTQFLLPYPARFQKGETSAATLTLLIFSERIPKEHLTRNIATYQSSAANRCPWSHERMMERAAASAYRFAREDALPEWKFFLCLLVSACLKGRKLE